MTRTRQPLNARHFAILAYISLYRTQHDYSPTIEEISTFIGLAKSHTWTYLSRLEQEGYIRRNKRIARSVQIVRRETDAG